MNQLILTNYREPIFEIVLNRPDKRNALNQTMYQELDGAISQCLRLNGVRAVIIRGEGKLFSAGIDVTAFLTLSQQYGDQWLTKMRRITDDFQAVLTRLERLELPTIALLHGYCLGLAMELALACDFRLAAKGTQLGLPESRLGIIPDVGGTTRLTRLVGPSRAKELVLTGKQIDAALAVQWGLVNQVVPADQLLSAAETLVGELCQAAPLAVGMGKRIIDGLADIDRGLMLEGWAQSQLMQTTDFQEGVQAFLTRRPPQFQGK